MQNAGWFELRDADTGRVLVWMQARSEQATPTDVRASHDGVSFAQLARTRAAIGASVRDIADLLSAATLHHSAGPGSSRDAARAPAEPAIPTWFELQEPTSGIAILWMRAVSEKATPTAVVDGSGGVSAGIARHYAETSGMSVEEITSKLGHTARLVRSEGPPNASATG